MGAKTPTYCLLNGRGALLILVSLYFNFNLSSVIIELFWLLFSVIGLVRYRGSKVLEDGRTAS